MPAIHQKLHEELEEDTDKEYQKYLKDNK